MSRDTDKSRLFTRRAIVVGGFKMGLLSLLAGRLYYLQVLQNERLRTLADDNRIHLRLIAPSRGHVEDRTGAPLAINQQNYRIVVTPEQVKDMDQILTDIGQYVDLQEINMTRLRNELRRSSGYAPILVRDNLSWEQVSRISLHMPELSGVDIEVGQIRAYPYGPTTAHVVGYTGLVTSEDQSDKIAKTIPGFRVGKSAIERQYDQALRGKPGDVQLEVNAHGRVVRELDHNPPVSGEDIRLTLDIGLQQFVHSRLEKEESAAAVIMDIHTGAVYALVSHPSFDPNLFSYGLNQEEWKFLSGNPRLPLLNKALDGVYEPGSTFKIVTALAGLDSGLCDPEEKIFCSGHIEVGNHRFHCWKKGGHGAVNLKEALAESCDVYFYELGKRVGINRIHAMAERLGLGQKTGIDLPHERTGLIPNRAWKRAVHGSSWKLGETIIASIGQGYVLTTPLQLAVMTARIANGGYAVEPHILMQKGPAEEFERLGFDEDHIKIIQEGLDMVVNSPLGTARWAQIQSTNPDFTMAGKTGTSQVRRISNAERADGVLKNEALPWNERDHALFVGFAPVHNPRYVAAVIVEHGGSGTGVAAPIARDILHATLKRKPG
ncbi:MAG: penicillin-binding protein 2 [Bdellovibrionales bacterium]